MDIRYIESLINVADSGSIAQAAQAQHLTPAAIGQRIASLEAHFGVMLLDRTAHKATPTQACTHLLPRARKLVEDYHEMERALSTTGLSGKFELGAISTILTGVIPSVLQDLATAAPELFLGITPGTSQSLYNNLCDGTIDAAVVCLPPEPLPDRFATYPIRNEPLVLISRDARGRTIREKLERNSYICYDSNSWGGAKAATYIKDNGIDAEPAYELDALETIEKLVAKGMGVSLVPQWVGLDLHHPKLMSNIVRDMSYRRTIAFVTHRHLARTQIVETLLGSLKRSLLALEP